MNEKTLTGEKDIWDILLLFEIYENLLKHNNTLIKRLEIGPKFFADTWPETVTGGEQTCECMMLLCATRELQKEQWDMVTNITVAKIQNMDNVKG